MVFYGLATQEQQQLLLLQRHAMMEHRLQQQQQQQQQQSPTSPSQSRSRQISVYLSDAKPAAFNFGVNPEAAALCTNSSNLPTLRGSVSSGTASSSSPTVLTPSSAASSTPPPAPATTTRTSFMISDILDSPGSRSRSCNSSAGGVIDKASASFRAYSDEPSNGRDSPGSVVSDDAEAKERDNREDSVGASDSDVERSSQSGESWPRSCMCMVYLNLHGLVSDAFVAVACFLTLLPFLLCRQFTGHETWKEETTEGSVLSWAGV